MHRSLLTIEEASKELNLKTSRLRSAIFKREIPYIKIGRLIRFRMEDLNEWLEKQLRKPNSQY